MTTTQGDLASLSRYIFRAPRWYTSLTFAVALAALTGVAAFDSKFILQDAWEGVFFIGLPTIAATGFTPMVDRRFGGHLTTNRASLLAVACELIVVAFLTIAGLAALFTTLSQPFVIDALLMALAAIFAFRLLVILAISRHRLLVAAVPASIQTVTAAVMLFVYSGTIESLTYGGPLLAYLLARPTHAPEELVGIPAVDFGLLAIMCVIYAGAVYVFIQTLDRPWRNSLGVSALDFIQGFIGHIAEGSRELEDFFEQLGEDAVVPVTVCSFRRADGSEKARFVLPMIHPGPMGEIGGGNLPVRVAEQARGLAFPPHATAGHDFNLVTEHEVDTIIEAAETASDRLEYTDAATRSHRHVEGEATLLGQAFGDAALVVTTFAPGYADDVDYAVGLSAKAEARTDELDDVLLVDAHNSNDGLDGDDLGHVVPGSHRSFDVIHGAGKLGTTLAAADRHPLALGTAWDETPWDPEDGIGPLGIRVAVVEVGDQTTAYVLVDGNNMEPGLRDDVLTALDPLVDVAEVMTSDTHIVNTVEAVNQVGQAIPQDDFIALVADLVDRAAADTEAVEAGMATEHAEVTVFGNDRTETLASHANAAISMGGALAATFILAVFAVSVLLFFLTP
jgi:putative membrane protein